MLIFYNGSVAEWSKALVLGTSLSRRGFESHRCQIAFAFLIPLDTCSVALYGE